MNILLHGDTLIICKMNENKINTFFGTFMDRIAPFRQSLNMYVYYMNNMRFYSCAKYSHTKFVKKIQTNIIHYYIIIYAIIINH